MVKPVTKFSHDGYELTIVSKESIIETIEENILDKEVMYEIIKQLEFDANKFLKEGRWITIPHLGTIKFPEGVKLINTQLDLIRDAKETLPKEEYVAFINNLRINNDREIKHNRLYKYLTAMAVNKHLKEYRKLAKRKGETYARLKIYFISCIKYIGNEYCYYE